MQDADLTNTLLNELSLRALSSIVMSDTSDVDSIPFNIPELNTALMRLEAAIADQARGINHSRINLNKDEARLIELLRRQHIINKRLRKLHREEAKRINEEAAAAAAAAAAEAALPQTLPTSSPTESISMSGTTPIAIQTITSSPTASISPSPATPTLPTTPDWGSSAPGTPLTLPPAALANTLVHP